MDFFKLAVDLTRAEAAPTLARVAAKYKAIKEIADDEDESICPTCNGSGEGMYDGSRCGHCGGSGVESTISKEDIEAHKADLYNDQREDR